MSAERDQQKISPEKISPDRTSPGASRLDGDHHGAEIRRRITHGDAILSILRQAYAEVLSEPMPDRFRRLLGQLVEGDRG